jgi:hypothetical protein
LDFKRCIVIFGILVLSDWLFLDLDDVKISFFLSQQQEIKSIYFSDSE